MDKAGIIILNYNGYEDTINCVKSLSVIRYPSLIIVIDNCSSNNDYYKLKENLPAEVVLLRTDKNLGYAGGNNVGLKYAVKEGCSFLCILNNDTIVEEDFLTLCIEELIQDKNIGFIGPTLLDYETGLVQSTGGDIFIGKGKVTQKNNGCKASLLPKYIDCDYIGGACIVLRKDILNEIGYIPESYFLFFEETEWCYHAEKLRYHNICLGNTIIIHKGSESINKIEGLANYLFYRNKIAFIRRNCENKLQAFIIYLALLIKNFLLVPRYHNVSLERALACCDGWNKKVNLKKYPFIIINES